MKSLNITMAVLAVMLFVGCKTQIGGRNVDPNDPDLHYFHTGSEFKLQSEANALQDNAQTLNDD